MNSLESILLPYQRRWVEDRSPRKIWLASRQSGKSFTLAAEAVYEAFNEKRSINLILSASERQSREVMEKVTAHLRYFRVRTGDLVSPDETREEVRLPNGSRIISLPANPDTVRGFSGNVFLDEFAFHQDAEEIWRAMYPAVTRGFRLRVSSTPNGTNRNLFHDLWTKGRGFSRHQTTIYDAVREGLAVSPEELKAGILDAHAWAQEYECIFLDGTLQFIPLELIQSCEDEGATVDLEWPLAQTLHAPIANADKAPARDGSVQGRAQGHAPAREGEYYLGLDIGRKHDLTVFWLWQKTAGVFWTRMVREFRQAPFRAQREFLYALLEGSYGFVPAGAAIDSAGIGAQIAEEAEEKFGPLVLRVSFTPEVKQQMAVGLKRRLEEKTLRLPISREIREDFASIKRVITQAGHVAIGAARTDEGHADRFWAAALGLRAANCAPCLVEFETAGAKREFVKMGRYFD